jgi:hypothetical protein
MYMAVINDFVCIDFNKNSLTGHFFIISILFYNLFWIKFYIDGFVNYISITAIKNFYQKHSLFYMIKEW